ncbi:hypothetical protein A9Q99_10680 [Gammaproteobacteria bacterium 45_16_T64]|nr:hypothetical protein A9Q99_10680 [Gammaproteobacteria bacterium 45_16_T64]
MKKEILIIGAGAVGLVYGKHFADAGHQVTFFVREKYLDEMSKGSILYHLNQDKSLNRPIRFTQYSLISTYEEVHQHNWDQVYLCISSTALQSFDFSGFQEALQGKPTVIMLQPSVQDLERLRETFPKEQIVEGMITLISYGAPLATENVDIPGIAYWLPPFMPTPFSGQMNRRQEVIKTFLESQIAAKSSKSVGEQSLFPTAFLMAFLTALESSQWKFDSLTKDAPLLKQLTQSIQEIFASLEAQHQVRRPFPLRLISPAVIKALLRLAPHVMPMDIETYFEAHFTKVKDQTKLYMKNYLDTARAGGKEHATLQVLNQLT